MSSRATVIQAEHLAPEAAAWLAERCRLVTAAPPASVLERVLEDAHGLVVRTYTDVDARLLSHAPRLRVVGRAGAGLDNIDVAACRARGVEVVYTPDANTQAVVEYVLGLLARAVRDPPRLERAVDADTWRSLRRRYPERPQMSEAVLGILGLGRIGRRLAGVAAAIGFRRVLYNDLVTVPPAERHGAMPVSAGELFSEADVLSIHVDGRPSNRGFVGAALLSRMKPDVVFLNTSRGFVVESRALAAFLDAHPKALALLDVHEEEPFDAGYPLLGHANAWLYPHAAASTRAADLAMSWVVRDVVAVLEGRRPAYPAPRGSWELGIGNCGDA